MTKRKIEEVDDVESREMAIPSLKDLASSEPKLRRHALQKIQEHLETRPARSPFTSTQADQLWRGFHVLLYMHDSKNMISVQTLIATLAGTFQTIREKDQEIELEGQPRNGEGKGAEDEVEEEEEFAGFDSDPESVSQSKSAAKSSKQNGSNTNKNKPSMPPTPPKSSSLSSSSEENKSWLKTYTSSFWSTLIREWSTIDSHRLNKYLLLIRFVMRQLFQICVTSTSTITEVTKVQADLFTTFPLNPRNSNGYVANGLKLHVLDVYVDELAPFFSSSGDGDGDSDTEGKEQGRTKEMTIVKGILKEPLEILAKNGIDRIVRTRAKEEIEEYESRILKVGGS